MGRPYTIELSPGERKALCSCGDTQKGPICDGSHKGSDCTPIIVHFTNENKVVISGTTCGTAEDHAHGGGCCRNEKPSKLTKMEEDHGHGHGGCCRNEKPSKLTKMEEEDHGHGHGGCCRH